MRPAGPPPTIPTLVLITSGCVIELPHCAGGLSCVMCVMRAGKAWRTRWAGTNGWAVATAGGPMSPLRQAFNMAFPPWRGLRISAGLRDRHVQSSRSCIVRLVHCRSRWSRSEAKSWFSCRVDTGHLGETRSWSTSRDSVTKELMTASPVERPSQVPISAVLSIIPFVPDILSNDERDDRQQRWTWSGRLC